MRLRNRTYKTWVARVVDVDKIRVQVEVLLLAHLDSGICRLVRLGCWWEIDLRINSVWCNVDLGDRLGGESCLVDDNLLDLRVGWL